MRIAWVLVVAACGSSSSPSKLDGGDGDGGGDDATPPGPTWSVTLATPIQVAGATVDESGIYLSLVDQTTATETRRIEKRLLATGELDTTFGTGGATAGGPGPLATDEASLYVFDGNARVVTKLAKANGTDQAWAVSGPLVMIANPAGLFTGGTDPAGGIQAWGMIRRDPATGAIAFWTRGDYPCTNGLTSSVRGVFIDGADLFATGVGCGGSQSHWRTQRRDLATTTMTWQSAFDNGGTLAPGTVGSALVADADAVYTLGDNGIGGWAIEKRTRATGDRVTTFGQAGVVQSDMNGYPIAIAQDATSIYVANFVDAAVRIDKHTKATGALVPSFGTGGMLTIPTSSFATTMVVAAGSIFVIGMRDSLSPFIERRHASNGAL